MLISACLRSSSGHFVIILKPFCNPMQLQDGPKQLATPLQRPDMAPKMDYGKGSSLGIAIARGVQMAIIDFTLSVYSKPRGSAADFPTRERYFFATSLIEVKFFVLSSWVVCRSFWYHFEGILEATSFARWAKQAQDSSSVSSRLSNVLDNVVYSFRFHNRMTSRKRFGNDLPSHLQS